MILVLVVDSLALICAFPANGATREWIYGRKNTGTLEVIQCLLGPCTVGLTLVAVAVCFLAVLASICGLLPYFTVLHLGSFACETDPPKTNSLAAALARSSFEARPETEISSSLTSFCKEDYWVIT